MINNVIVLYNIFDLQNNIEKPFMYWLTLQKYYTKFCRIESFESTFYRYKTIMLEVIFQHDFSKR